MADGYRVLGEHVTGDDVAIAIELTRGHGPEAIKELGERVALANVKPDQPRVWVWIYAYGMVDSGMASGISYADETGEALTELMDPMVLLSARFHAMRGSRTTEA